MTSTTRTCAACRFWDPSAEPFHNGEIGDCRRHAPRINDTLLARTMRVPSMNGGDFSTEEIERDVYNASAYPISHRDQWCGDFERAIAGVDRGSAEA